MNYVWLYTLTIFIMVRVEIVFAQQPISVSELIGRQALNTAKSWRLAGNVLLHPDKPGFLRITDGNDLLVGTPGTSLATSFSGNRLRLFFDYLLSENAAGRILLPGGQALILSQQNGIYVAGAGNGARSHPEFPTVPGLWQHVELDYEALPYRDGNARVGRLFVNGVPVYLDLLLPAANPAAPSAITFTVDKGLAAFRDLRIEIKEERRPVSLVNLRYHLYKDKWGETLPRQLERSDTCRSITHEIAYGMKDFHLRFDGELAVSESGLYTFDVLYCGPLLKLEINGKQVVSGGFSGTGETHTGSVYLEEGADTFSLWYTRFPWQPPALGLRISREGVVAYDLHEPASLPPVVPKPMVSVDSDGQSATIIRSFVHLTGESGKRPYCLSVGGLWKRNYTLDLSHGTLLQVWSGDFADVTEMWFERGEPQLLYPRGAVRRMSHKKNLTFLPEPLAAWNDSTQQNLLHYQLDQRGFPTFCYQTRYGKLYDHIMTTPEGITRTVSAEMRGSFQVKPWILLAEGGRIERISRRLFRIDGMYYIRTKSRLHIYTDTATGIRELRSGLRSSLTYSIIW